MFNDCFYILFSFDNVQFEIMYHFDVKTNRHRQINVRTLFIGSWFLHIMKIVIRSLLLTIIPKIKDA